MQIQVMSRRELEKAKLNDGVSYAIISITDPFSSDVMLKKTVDTKKILRLSFHDVSIKSYIYYPMSEKDSDRVAKFVRKIKDNTEILIVQCEAGISRSAGVAAAISKWLWDNDDIYFNYLRFIPNMACYRTVLNSLYKTLDK